jgi:transcriptional regulator with XRE-family HTH domain
MKKPKALDEVDVQVGQRIRIQRLAIRMSQKTLANAVGMSFQQVQKYENGESRIGAGRLTTIATALGVPVTNLLGAEDSANRKRERQGAAESPLKLLADRGALKLLRAYGKLSDGRMQRSIVQLLEHLAAGCARR